MTADMSLPHVLDEKLWITITLIVDDELSEFERLIWGALVRPNDRVERRSSVRRVLTSVLTAAARRSLVLLGGSTDVGSSEQNSRQEHV